MDRRTLQERVGLYSLLRSLYRFPLTESLIAAVAELKVACDSPLAASLRQMQAPLHSDGSRAAMLGSLNVEMTRLLEGPGLTPAPPYASYYLHGGQLMGPEAVAARRVYLKWKGLPDGQTRLPDDHLSLELGFLALLADPTIRPGTDTVAALVGSRDFIQRHLLPWLPRFCDRMATVSKDPFFIGLAHFTQTAVESDLNWLTAALAESAIETTDFTSSR